jgi:hypothetical protein
MNTLEKRESRRHKAHPAITDEFMELDRPCGGFGLKIRRSMSETKRRHIAILFAIYVDDVGGKGYMIPQNARPIYIPA